MAGNSVAVAARSPLDGGAGAAAAGTPEAASGQGPWNRRWRPHGVGRARRGLLKGYERLRARNGPLSVEHGRPVVRRLDAELLLGIGRDYREAGRLSDAVTALTRAKDLVSAHPRVDYVLGHARGEKAVLSGAWQAPAFKASPFIPITGRVLHVVHKSLPWVQAGYTIRTQAVVECQRRAGLDPYVTTADGFPPPDIVGARSAAAVERVGDVPHWRLLSNDGYWAPMDVRLTRRIVAGAKVVEAVRPAVLHAASDFLNAEAALAWGRVYGIPVVYEVRGFWADTWLAKAGEAAASSELYLGRQARELACMHAADAVVTLAEVMKDEIVAQGIDPEKVTVIPNAVDADTLTPGPRDAALARRLGIGPADMTIGYVSSLTHYEGIDTLLHATARLVAMGRPVKALIVGDGKERQRLEALARQLRLGDRAIFTGEVPVSDVPDYYRLLDVFVVPRTPERVCRLVTPLKPYEAMACGIPVVASDLPALAEMIQHGETGLLYAASDIPALTEVVGHLIDRPALRCDIGNRAARWVANHRRWDQSGQLYAVLTDRLRVAV